MIKQANRKCILCVALLLLAASAWSCDSWFARQYVVTTIPVGAGRTVIISTDLACEISCGIFYEVKVGDQTVASTCLICSGDAKSLTFKPLFAENGNLVAVYEETRPERLLLLHDFATGESWPRSLATEWSEQTQARGVALLEVFQKEHPERQFTIEWGEACGVTR